METEGEEVSFSLVINCLIKRTYAKIKEQSKDLKKL